MHNDKKLKNSYTINSLKALRSDLILGLSNVNRLKYMSRNLLCVFSFSLRFILERVLNMGVKLKFCKRCEVYYVNPYYTKGGPLRTPDGDFL